MENCMAQSKNLSKATLCAAEMSERAPRRMLALDPSNHLAAGTSRPLSASADSAAAAEMQSSGEAGMSGDLARPGPAEQDSKFKFRHPRTRNELASYYLHFMGPKPFYKTLALLLQIHTCYD